jgi:hypothetical protein
MTANSNQIRHNACELSTRTTTVISQRVLYCGDTSLGSAAAYLAGLLTHWNIDFDYVSSDRDLPDDAIASAPRLIIFSDYPAACVSESQHSRIMDLVAHGAGLLMIGGWESFHGLGGDWDTTPLADILPVAISSSDDRTNCDCPVLVRPTVDSHPVIDGLPWSTRPPLIGGFNQFTPKAGAEVLLESVQFAAATDDNTFTFRMTNCAPLLVTGRCGSGRTAALATDVAPHWVGPLVDWGDNRVTAQAEGAEAIEVGNLYAQFFGQLVTWCLG